MCEVYLCNHFWLEHLFNFISLEINIQSLTFVVSKDSKYANEASSVLRGLSTKNIAVFTTEFSMQQNLRADEALYIFYPFERHEYGNLAHHLHSLLFSRVRNIPTLTNSKVLIVLRNEYYASDEIESALRYAWFYKFLDFSIIDSRAPRDCRSNVTIHFLNPFSDVHVRSCVTRDTSFFPDKLRDMREYALNLGVMHMPPAVNVTCADLNSRLCKVTGRDYDIALTLSKVMNFSIHVVPIFFDRYGPYIQDVGYVTNENLQLANIEFIINHLFPLPDAQNPIRISQSIFFDEICAMVPILRKPSPSMATRHNFIMFFVVMMTCCFVYALKKSLKFDQFYWDVFYVSILFINITVPRVPRKVKERILFMSLNVAALHFSSFLLNKLTDSKVSYNEEIALDSYDDLLKMKLFFMLDPIFIPQILDTDFESLRVLVNKSIHNANYTDCINILRKGKNVTCIGPKSIAKGTIRQQKNSFQKSPVMKISKIRFWSSGEVIIYEPKSPYVGKIDQILLIIASAGLHFSFGKSEYIYKSIYIKNEFELEDDDLLMHLLFVLMLGYLLSLITLVIEIAL